MRVPRIYCEENLKIGTTVMLDSRNCHYLLNVLRLKTGHAVILFNGDGNDYEGKITRIPKKCVEIKISNRHTVQSESPLFIELGQGISHGNKMDYVIQKAVELGVNRIVPLITERSQTKARRLSHWQGVIISACEQSGRARLPELTAPQLLDDWLSQKRKGLCFVCHKGNWNKELTASKVQRATLLIGPEGGLSNEEISRATATNFTNLSLGPRTLRTETATVAALSLMQAYFGDLM